jgi:ubiquinone biosynthesis protein COQ9
MPKTENDFEKKICIAALRLSSSRGWKNVTLELIAKAAKVPSVQMKKRFAGKNDVLVAIMHFVTDKAVAAAGKMDRHSPPRDRLFDLLMARFDILQKHRKGILGIMAWASRDSGIMCVLLPAQKQDMQKILAHAGLDQEGLGQPLAVMGLWIIYLAALRVWRQDETLDMAKTMAALDRYLRYADKAAEIIFRSI